MTLSPAGAALETGGLVGAHLVLPEWGSDPLPLRPVSTSPCTAACPAGIEVKTYVSLIAEGRFDEALDVVRERCPLPGVCGRVCTHPCEAACARSEHDDPVAIRALKRFVADLEMERTPIARTPAFERPERVAVIGSGPAGLTAAYDLRLRGYRVTIYEAESEPGGMLRHGIADYRLPPGVLDKEIDTILRTGIELRTGMRLGRDLELESILHGDHRAVVLAVGAQIGRRLGLRDESRAEVIEDALAFLRRLNAGDHQSIGRRVLVVGGGSTAIEAARAALRVGAESSHLVYRRSREQMPASHEEIEAAQSEGVQFTFLASPSRVAWNEDGTFAGLEFVRAKLGEPDASGRPRPVPVPGSEFVMQADKVLAAIGQDIDLRFLPPRGRTHLSDGRRLHVDASSGATRLAGVFAAGDLMTGPSTVIEAIATGHRAAASVARFLETGRFEPVPRTAVEHVEYELPDGAPARSERREPPLRPLDPRRPFEEVEPGLTAEDAVAEARRCLRCGPCDECRICAPSCHRRHLALGVDVGEAETMRVAVRAPATLTLALADEAAARGVLRFGPAGGNGETGSARELPAEVMPLRATVAREECRACGTCVEACPFEAIRTVTPVRGNSHAWIESSLCRGCNLCTSVCPTHAARPNVFSLDHWGFEPAHAPRVHTGEVVLVCQQQLETFDAEAGFAPDRQMLRMRCLGQVDPGLVLGLLQRGASRVLVASCANGDCRYTSGSSRSAEVFEQSRRFLRDLGLDAEARLGWWRDGEASPVASTSARAG